jgi:hypothetical protein
MQWKGDTMRTDIQKYQVLNYLQKGKTITSLQALDKFGCMRLASRINELRYEGHDINTILKSDGEKRWAEYKLLTDEV